MECQEKINEDMAYALSYLSIYSNQLNVPKMHREMNNLMIIYGLSDMIYRGMTLVKFYAPNGVMLSEILHSCFCSHYNKCLLIKQLSVTSNSYICSGHTRIGTDAKEHKVFASES